MRRFIDHPIGTTLVMVAILLAGLAAFLNLPIAALPPASPGTNQKPRCPASTTSADGLP